MAEEEGPARECPFCKEEVKADAVRCKHCHAGIAPASPPHGGVCPFCKEDIHPDAIRCKHCQANLASARGCAGCSPPDDTIRIPRPARSQLRVRMIAARRTTIPPTSEQCHGCPPATMEGSEMWCLVDCDDEYCIYEKCGYV